MSFEAYKRKLHLFSCFTHLRICWFPLFGKKTINLYFRLKLIIVSVEKNKPPVGDVGTDLMLGCSFVGWERRQHRRTVVELHSAARRRHHRLRLFDDHLPLDIIYASRITKKNSVATVQPT